MPLKVTLEDGKVIFLPDGWTDEQVYAHVRSLEGREPTADYGSAFRRGLGKHAPDIIDLGAGLTGIAADITGSGTLSDTEASIRDFSDTLRTDIGGPSMQDVSDTFGEKVVEGLGSIPGIAGSFAPTMLIPGSGIAGAALKFGAHGAAMAGGEGPGTPIGGAVQGALAGAAFGGMGQVARGIANPVGRHLTHTAGTTGLVTGMGVVGGEDPQDALAMGLAMGAVAGLSRTPHEKDVQRSAAVRKIFDRIKEERKARGEKSSEQDILADAAIEYEQGQRTLFEAEGGKKDVMKELGLSLESSPEAYITKEVTPKINMNSINTTIRVEGHRAALKSLTEGEVHDLFTKDTYNTRKAIEEVGKSSVRQRKELSDKWGVKGQILSDHELIKINLLTKMMMRDHAQLYQKYQKGQTRLIDSTKRVRLD